jgi:hypothetical protein
VPSAHLFLDRLKLRRWLRCGLVRHRPLTRRVPGAPLTDRSRWCPPAPRLAPSASRSHASADRRVAWS